MSTLAARGGAEIAQRVERAWVSRQRRTRATMAIGAAILVTVCVTALSIGAIRVPFDALVDMLLAALGLRDLVDDRAVHVLTAVRLPRVLYGVIAGAALGLSGACLQTLVRNPLADPGLVGVTSGATLGAVACIVAAPHVALVAAVAPVAQPACAFAGALVACAFVARFAESAGGRAASSLLLAGIAVNALAFALVGLAIAASSESQLRAIAMWNLGSLAGATWQSLAVAAPLALGACALLVRSARSLDAIVLGRSEALHLGVDVARVRRTILVGVALAVGTITAWAGPIAFVGLVAPHVARALVGVRHALLLPAAALAGATLLVGADTLARTVLAPAELPIGVLTALMGAPFFLVVLMRERRVAAA